MPRPTPASPSRGTPLLPLYIVLGLVALAGVYFLVSQTRGAGGATATEPIPVQLTPEQLQRVPGISRGDPNAPITLFEFADYTCPGCRQFTTFMEPVIFERLVNTGKVRYVFYDFPLGGGAHRHGFVAARAARCANDQGRFWEFHDAVFAGQGDWAFSDDPVEHFLQYAREVGLDAAAFETCVRSDRFQREVSENRRFGESLGVNSTPTLIANGQRLPNLPGNYAELESMLRGIAPGAFAEAAAAPAGSAAADSAP